MPAFVQCSTKHHWTSLQPLSLSMLTMPTSYPRTQMILHNLPNQNHKILTLPNNQSLHLILVFPKHNETSSTYITNMARLVLELFKTGPAQANSILLNPLPTAKHYYALHVNMDPLRNIFIPHLPMHLQIDLKHQVNSYLSLTWYLDLVATFLFKLAMHSLANTNIVLFGPITTLKSSLDTSKRPPVLKRQSSPKKFSKHMPHDMQSTSNTFTLIMVCSHLLTLQNTSMYTANATCFVESMHTGKME